MLTLQESDCCAVCRKQGRLIIYNIYFHIKSDILAGSYKHVPILYKWSGADTRSETIYI